MSNRIQSLLAIGLGCVMLLCSGALQAGPVNINTADAATLARELSGCRPEARASHCRVPAEAWPIQVRR